MINPMKYKYLVAIMTADKRLTTSRNLSKMYPGKRERISLRPELVFQPRTIKLQREEFLLLPSLGVMQHFCIPIMGGKNAEATRGKIVEWNPSARTSGEKFKVKAYDVLYDLQESQDHVYFSAGVKTKSAIVQVLKRWGIKVTSYSGPNVKHGETGL